MKKIICLVLALLMVFSMAACQSESTETTAPPVEEVTESPTEATTQATEPPTETMEPIMPTEPAEPIGAAELSLAENSTTVTFDTPKEYDVFLNEMGYVEVHGQECTHNLQGGIPWQPTKLVYNDTYFRVDFDYSVYKPEEYAKIDIALSEVYNSSYNTSTGWSLYGTRSTEGVQNISPFQEEEENFVFTETFTEMEDDFVTQVDYICVSEEDMMYGDGSGKSSTMMYYYPDTHNLYNIVYKYDSWEDAINYPYILYRQRSEMERQNTNRHFVYTDFEPGVRYAMLGIEGEEYNGDKGECMLYYEIGMTFAEFCESPLSRDRFDVAPIHPESPYAATMTHAAFTAVGPWYLLGAERDVRDIIKDYSVNDGTDRSNYSIRLPAAVIK